MLPGEQAAVVDATVEAMQAALDWNADASAEAACPQQEVLAWPEPSPEASPEAVRP